MIFTFYGRKETKNHNHKKYKNQILCEKHYEKGKIKGIKSAVSRGGDGSVECTPL